MSFALSHYRLFAVTVRDDDISVEQPVGALLKGLKFIPTSVTQQRLKDHQLIFRVGEYGFEVYYRTNPLAADPLLGCIRNSVRFSFLIYQTDGELFSHYGPDLTGETGPQFYLDNLSDSGDIELDVEELSAGSSVDVADAMKTCADVFTLSADVSGPSPPTEFRVIRRFPPLDVLESSPIVASTGSDVGVAKFDLSGLPSGPYTLDTDAPGSNAKTIYKDNDVVAARVKGVLDVHWNERQDLTPAGGRQFVVRFEKQV
jgi:hypothetical protein